MLRSRDESCWLRRRLAIAIGLILHVSYSYSWTLIFDVTGSHAENR